MAALRSILGSGTILHANRAELNLLGYSAEDYIGRNIAEFHADPATIENILYRLKRGESLRKYPASLCARDETIKHVEITSSANIRDGEFINTRCFTVDVTDLMSARQEVRRQDDRFQQVLDALWDRPSAGMSQRRVLVLYDVRGDHRAPCLGRRRQYTADHTQAFQIDCRAASGASGTCYASMCWQAASSL